MLFGDLEWVVYLRRSVLEMQMKDDEAFAQKLKALMDDLNLQPS
jgi:hypothetical protein